MKDTILNIILGLIIGSLLVVIVYCLDRCAKAIITDAVTSTPVEEMYNRQLVNTLDSILDARFGPGCCEEDINTVSANTFNTRFDGNISPKK